MSALDDDPWLVRDPVLGTDGEQLRFGLGEPPDGVISDEITVGFFLKLAKSDHQHCLCSRAQTVVTFKPCVCQSILYRALQRSHSAMFPRILEDLEMPRRDGGLAERALRASYQYRGLSYVATEITEVGWVAIRLP